MPFNIDYTPIGTYYRLGYAGGLGQYRLAQQEMQQKQMMQERALQYNLISQGVAHENTIERMKISEEMQREAQSRQNDFKTQTAILANQWADKRHTDEMMMRHQEFLLNQEGASLNRSITESYRAGQIMDNIEQQKLRVAELEGQNWQYRNPQDLFDWEQKWKQAVSDHTIEGVAKAMYLADIMSARPMPTLPPPPPKRPTVEPIMDQEGNVIGHAMLEVGANGSERWVPVKGGEGGPGSKGTPGSPGSIARLGSSAYGQTWSSHLAMADAHIKQQFGDRFQGKSPMSEFGAAWDAITSNVDAYNDVMLQARNQIKEEAELAAKFKGTGEGAIMSPMPDLSPAAVMLRAKENVKSYIEGTRQENPLNVELDRIKTNTLQVAGVKESDIIPVILPPPDPKEFDMFRSGDAWHYNGWLTNPAQDKNQFNAAFLKHLQDNSDVYKGRVIGPIQTDNPGLVQRGGEFWSFYFDGKQLMPYAPQPPSERAPGQAGAKPQQTLQELQMANTSDEEVAMGWW